MKKIILMLALALPMFAFAQKNAAPSVIGHINSQEIMASMPEINEIKLKLDTLQGTYENHLANMQEEFNKKVTEFQQQQATMTDGIKQYRQQELAEMEQRIQQFYQTVQQELQAKQAELMLPVQQRLLDAIKKVATAKNCAYVMDSTAMLYASPDALNLTAAVKAELGIK